MKKRLFIALILILMLVPTSIAVAKDKPLRYETTYDLAITGDVYEGRTHTWDGVILVDGECVGTIDWYMYPGELPPPTTVVHWEGAIWTINFLDGTFIEGEERGSTTWLLHKGEAIWRANGVVTNASDTDLIGRPIHDGGFVDLTTMSGVGKIQINK